MSRITDNKIIGPVRQPDETRVREQPERREVPVPPGARVASTMLNPIQRADNQRLIALYHALKEKKTSESASQDFEARLKGWKKRPASKKKNKNQKDEDREPEQEKEQDEEQKK